VSHIFFAQYSYYKGYKGERWLAVFSQKNIRIDNAMNKIYNGISMLFII